MPKKKSPNNVRIRNGTAEFLTFAYQTGGDGVEVRVAATTKEFLAVQTEGKRQVQRSHTQAVALGWHSMPLEARSGAEEFSVTAADGKKQIPTGGKQ